MDNRNMILKVTSWMFIIWGAVALITMCLSFAVDAGDVSYTFENNVGIFVCMALFGCLTYMFEICAGIFALKGDFKFATILGWAILVPALLNFIFNCVHFTAVGFIFTLIALLVPAAFVYAIHTSR